MPITHLQARALGVRVDSTSRIMRGPSACIMAIGFLCDPALNLLLEREGEKERERVIFEGFILF